jgi:DNA-binding response OmpR family regulator
MKTDVLLIAEGWDESSAIIAEAANRTGHGFRHLAPSRASELLLLTGTAEIEPIVVDIDPDIHDFSVVDSITAEEKMPPIIVVARGDESWVRDLACRHGAAAVITKPFTVLDMEWLIDELCPCAVPLPLSCDLWGHPRKPRKRAFRRHAR